MDVPTEEHVDLAARVKAHEMMAAERLEEKRAKRKRMATILAWAGGLITAIVTGLVARFSGD